MTILLLTHLFAAAPSPGAADRVSITRLITPGSPLDRWVAKKDGKVLWSIPALGGKVSDEKSGVTVIGSTDLVVVNRAGKILKRLPCWAANDPRVLILKGRFLVYDEGARAPGVYEPKTEGAHVWEWYKGERSVHVYDVAADRELWQAPEVVIGIPISCENGRVTVFRIVNGAQCMQNPGLTPQVAINELDIHTKQIHRHARLSLTRSGADRFFSAAIDQERIGRAKVQWTPTSVSVDGIFGRHFTGVR